MTPILQIPAKISPRLPGGRFHQVLVDNLGVEIGTLAGYYGNRESKTNISFPHSQIVSITLTPHRFWRYERCQVVYSDEHNQKRTIEIGAINSEFSSDELVTRYVAQTLQQLKDGVVSESIQPFLLDFPVVRPAAKLLVGLILFAGILILTSLKGVGTTGILFLGSVLIFMSMVAIGIDAIRLHTGWHPLVKVLAGVGTFALGFILFVAAAVLFEVLGAF